jgi:hypothetical protein
VQLGGKKYISNLVSLGFQPMLVHFFFINYLRPMEVEVEVAGPCGGGLGGSGATWKRHGGGEPMWRRALGGGPTWQRATGRGQADHNAD